MTKTYTHKDLPLLDYNHWSIGIGPEWMASARRRELELEGKTPYQKLPKKVRGKMRHDRRYKRIGDQQTKKTRASDIAPQRIGQGVPANHQATWAHQVADRLIQQQKKDRFAIFNFMSNLVKPQDPNQHIPEKEDS